jgi:hypothetical protein
MQKGHTFSSGPVYLPASKFTWDFSHATALPACPVFTISTLNLKSVVQSCCSSHLHFAAQFSWLAGWLQGKKFPPACILYI